MGGGGGEARPELGQRGDHGRDQRRPRRVTRALSSARSATPATASLSPAVAASPLVGGQAEDPDQWSRVPTEYARTVEPGAVAVATLGQSHHLPAVSGDHLAGAHSPEADQRRPTGTGHIALAVSPQPGEPAGLQGLAPRPGPASRRPGRRLRSHSGSPIGSQTSTHTGSPGDDQHRPAARRSPDHRDPAASARPRSTTDSGCVEPRTTEVSVTRHTATVRCTGSWATAGQAACNEAASPERSSTLHSSASSPTVALRIRQRKRAQAVSCWRGTVRSPEVGAPVLAGAPAQRQAAAPGAGGPPGSSEAPSPLREAGGPPCGCCSGGRRPPRSPRCAGPPLLRGITWSRFSAADPQYWHREPSRAKTVRRFTATR